MFESKIFKARQKSSKSFTLENIRLYGTSDAIARDFKQSRGLMIKWVCRYDVTAGQKNRDIAEIGSRTVRSL